MNSDSGESISGRRLAVNRRAKWWLAAYLLLVVAFAVHLVRTGRLTTLVMLAGILGVALVQNVRPPTTVSAEGIRRPWRREPFIPWALVEHVLAPGPETSVVRVVTTAGRTVNLSGIEASRTDAIARLGGRPVKAVPVPKPIERERTQREIELDVARRADRLAEERRRMAGS